jgi:hypothetical protein
VATSRLVQLADALATAIAAQSFVPAGCVIGWAWSAEYTLAELVQPHVTILPSARAFARVSRAEVGRDATLAIDIQQRLPQRPEGIAPATRLNPIDLLSESIAEWLLTQGTRITGGDFWAEARTIDDVLPIVDGVVEQYRLAGSQMSVTFRLEVG